VVVTTRLSPIDAPHTEIVSRMIGIGVWVVASVVAVNIVNIINSVNIIASIHMRVSMRCLYCMVRNQISEVEYSRILLILVHPDVIRRSNLVLIVLGGLLLG